MRAQKLPFWCHAFEAACADLDVQHRLTKALPSKVEGPRHPWTNGQVERMNRTIKEATVKRYHYDSHDQLRQHLSGFIDAYNFGCRLKTLNSRRTKPSAQRGTKNRHASRQTRTSKFRDQTSSGQCAAGTRSRTP